MYVDIVVPSYVAVYMEARFGKEFNNLACSSKFDHIRTAVRYFEFDAFILPAPVDIPGTNAIVRLEFPDSNRKFMRYGSRIRKLCDQADHGQADIKKYNFFYKEFWTALETWVQAGIYAGIPIVDSITGFMDRYGISEDNISHKTLRRMLERNIQHRPETSSSVVTI